MLETEFDVVIVGGGLAGSACAALLASRGWRVVLIEKSHFDKPRIGEVVPLQAVTALRECVGFDHQSVEDLCSAVSMFIVSWGGGVSPRESGQYLRIDRRRVDKSVFQAATEMSVVGLLGAQLKSVSRDNDRWRFRVGVAGKMQDLSARIAIEATGRTCFSPFTKLRKRIYADNSIATVLRISDKRISEASMQLESYPGGWWYASTFPNTERVVVHFSDKDLLPSNRIERFNCVLQRLSQGQIIKDWVNADSITMTNCQWSEFDSRMGIRQQVSGPGWLVVGDAQMSIDPLSGCGVLESVRSAVEAVSFVHCSLMGFGFNEVEFAEGVMRRYNHQIASRVKAYQSEARWSTFPFWQRRLVARDQSSYVSLLPLEHSV